MVSRRDFLYASTAAALGSNLVFPAGCSSGFAAADERKTAIPTTDEEFALDFETSEICGSIRAEDAYHGVARLIHKPTGVQVIDPRYSALNLFKLMSVNQVMGQPRQMARTVTVGPKCVEVKWVATQSHHAAIIARYEVIEPNAVDLTVTVRSAGTYRGYELFLSSYFDKALRPHVYLQPGRRKAPSLVVPTLNDVFRGTVLVFPRDAHAAGRCLDGRWDRNEQSTPTVQMCPVRHYQHCLAFQADADNQLAVVLMSAPRHCYAISTRYHADNQTDRLTSYSAFDLSLFGDDLLPDQERTVKVRLALTKLDDDLSEPLELYRAFLAEENQQLNQPNAQE